MDLRSLRLKFGFRRMFFLKIVNNIVTCQALKLKLCHSVEPNTTNVATRMPQNQDTQLFKNIAGLLVTHVPHCSCSDVTPLYTPIHYCNCTYGFNIRMRCCTRFLVVIFELLCRRTGAIHHATLVSEVGLWSVIRVN